MSTRKHEIQARLKFERTIGKGLGFEAAEAYKLLRINLLLSMAEEEKCKMIGVTSALTNEGKSTVSINLAYSLAETKKQVLWIEADMRCPIAENLFHLPESSGLSNVLTGSCELNDAIVTGVMQPTLAVLSAGDIPPNPTELLASTSMRKILEVVSEKFDYVIIDFPPITATSDGLVLAGILSGMIIVVRQDYCNRRALAETMRKMEFLKIKVLGFVMNDVVSDERKYKKAYKKKYGYGKYAYR